MGGLTVRKRGYENGNSNNKQTKDCNKSNYIRFDNLYLVGILSWTHI